MKKNKVVIHFVHTLHGGVASVVATLVNKQLENNIIPIVVYVNYNETFDNMLIKPIKKIKVDMKNILGYSMLFGMRIKKTYLRIKKEYEESEVIVHAHNVQTVGIFSNLKNIPIVCTLHSIRGNEKGIRNFISDILYRKILYNISKNNGKITSVSNAIKQFYGKNKFEIEVIYNGVDNLYFRKKQNKFTILHLGNISTAKGWDRTCQAFSLISKEIRKNMEFIFAGKLSSEYTLEKINTILKEKKIDKESKYLGFINNAGKILVPRADILVLASKNEGLGYVLIEALSQGIPIIGTATGGIVEVIENNYNGYLITDEKDIKNRILELYYDKELYKRISENALISYQKKFTSKVMYEKYLAVYTKLKTNGGKKCLKEK